MNTKTAVVLGAGPVGQHVARLFREKGLDVRIVTRSGTGIEGFEHRAADARDPQALRTATADAGIIVHAAGVPYQDWSRDLPAIQSSVLQAAEASGATAVFVENLYSYDASRMPLHETTPERPPTTKGALRLTLSNQWRQAHREGRVRAVAVRASDYLGPGATRSATSHFGSRFFPALEAGKPVAFLGDPDALHSFTYLPDFGRALVEAALDSSSWGRSWIAPSLAPTTARHLTQLLAAEAGVPAKVTRLPGALLKVLGWFNPMIREVEEMLYQFDRPFVADSSEFEAHFGWGAAEVPTALRETWRAHVRR